MRVAMYLRLSDEDAALRQDKKAESESISNQRSLLTHFIRSDPAFCGWEIVEFCDDGWSGKGFERPGFLKMLEEVKKGRLHCIIVKDLSRFGRDYLVVGSYISRVFPFLGVRFIAVNDGFDSSRPQDIDSLDTAFRTLLYDLYSRDLSAKVKNARRMRAERGAFLAPFAPYGYVKDPENKAHLLIDADAAEVVRRIFAWAMEGVGTTEIAVRLNREGVLTPMQYKREKGCSCKRWRSIHEDNFWTDRTVIKILQNECYTGKLVYGRYVRDRVGNGHFVRQSRDQWIVVDATHKAIVSEEDFQKAASQRKEKQKAVPAAAEKNPLRGKVVCGVCGHCMKLSRAKNARYFCRTPLLTERYACAAEGVLQADVHEMVVTQIRTYAACALSMERLLLLQKEGLRAEKKRARREHAVLQSRRNRLELAMQECYEQLVEGVIDRQTYLSQKEDGQMQLHRLNEQMAHLEQRMHRTNKQDNAFIEKYKEYTELATLTPQIAESVIKRVVLYPAGEVRIELALRDELEKLMACAEPEGV